MYTKGYPLVTEDNLTQCGEGGRPAGRKEMEQTRYGLEQTGARREFLVVPAPIYLMA